MPAPHPGILTLNRKPFVIAVRNHRERLRAWRPATCRACHLPGKHRCNDMQACSTWRLGRCNGPVPPPSHERLRGSRYASVSPHMSSISGATQSGMHCLCCASSCPPGGQLAAAAPDA